MTIESINRLSELTGKAPRTIKRRLESLTPTQRGKAICYESRAALPVLYGVGNANDDRLDPQTERAKLDRERRREIEIRNARAAGELIDANRVKALVVAMVTTAKGRLLALPSRVAAPVLRAQTLLDVERLIRDEIHAILTEMANDAERGGEVEELFERTAPPCRFGLDEND